MGDSADSDSEENDEGNVAIKQVERKRRNNPLVQSTKRVKLGFSKNSQSESSSEESEQESAVAVSYKSSRSGKKEGPADMGATSVVEIDTQADRDTQAVFERSLQM